MLFLNHYLPPLSPNTDTLASPVIILLVSAGFTEIVELLLGAADSTDCVKRMLDTADTEGDTVSEPETATALSSL